MVNREMTKEIVTVKDLAKYLHCHQSTIYRLVKRGDIPGFRLGGGWRLRLARLIGGAGARRCEPTAIVAATSTPAGAGERLTERPPAAAGR